MPQSDSGECKLRHYPKSGSPCFANFSATNSNDMSWRAKQFRGVLVKRD